MSGRCVDFNLGPAAHFDTVKKIYKYTPVQLQIDVIESDEEYSYTEELH